MRGLYSQPGFTPHQRRTPADVARLHARANQANVGWISEAPSTTPAGNPTQGAANPAPAKPGAPAPTPPPVLVPIPEDPPPDLADMLALCATLVRDG